MVFDRSNGVNWRIIAALAGLALVWANQPSNNGTANTPAAQANQKARQHQDVPSSISGISKTIKTQKTKAYSKEEQREQREIRNLQAQENSAYWAAAMFWATVAALVLSFFGIMLVWTTFRETRKSNDIARDHQRARLLPSAELGRTHHLSETMTVALRCENIGLSPA